jgi:guanine deaminase
VFNETGTSLASTFVDGKEVICNGQLTQIDEATILDEIAQEHAELAPLILQSEQAVQRLLPSYRRIWDRCLAVPIDKAVYSARFSD